MRDIKFRAWDGATMFPVNVLALAPVYWTCGEGRGVSLEYQPHIQVMQYTGLNDKTGQEIYESDILDCSYTNPMSGETIKRHFNVVYENGRFMAKCIGHSPYGDTMLYFEADKSIVIGNIYESLDLI
jgi:uncharacterized phage protein (TIGR01671 family)